MIYDYTLHDKLKLEIETMNTNIPMIKSIALWSIELLFTFTIFGFNIQIGSTVYNWFAGLFGGFLFFWVMYFDDQIDNKAAFKMAFMGPTLAVFLGPWICEIRDVKLEDNSAPVVYLCIAFFGLTVVKIFYGFSKYAEKELPAMFWAMVKRKLNLIGKKPKSSQIADPSKPK